MPGCNGRDIPTYVGLRKEADVQWVSVCAKSDESDESGESNRRLRMVRPSVLIIMTVCHYRETNVSLREPPQVEPL